MSAHPSPMQQLPAAIDGMQRAVASGDLDAMAAADRVLHGILGMLAPGGEDLPEALHASLRRAEQALLAARAATASELQRLGTEIEALQRQQTGAQAYASHDLPLDENA